MKRHFIVGTDCRTIETQKEKSQESTKGQILGSARDTVSTIENHWVTATPFCPAVSGEQEVDIYRACFNYAKVFFFLTKRKKRRKNGETDTVLRFPKDEPGLEASPLHPFSRCCPVTPRRDRWLARPTRVTWTAGQSLSVLRSVGGKSLCSMKLQGTGDIFSKKNVKNSGYMLRKPTIRSASQQCLRNRN